MSKLISSITKKRIKFTIITVWIFLTRSYDAYCTSQFTPDLSNEANPLVTVLGMNWIPLLITIGLLTIYVIYAYYISIFKPKKLIPNEKGYTFSEFVAFTYLGRKDKWTAIFYKFPKDLDRLNNWMGHILTQGLAFAGLISTVMWILINNTEFYKNIHSAQLIYGILIIGWLAMVYNWNRILYKYYLTEINHE